jgi:hypothetical protein
VELTSDLITSDDDLRGAATIWRGRQESALNGIVFPSVSTYRVKVSINLTNGAAKSHGKKPRPLQQVVGSQIVFVPDTNADHAFIGDFTRTPFVTRVTNVGFSSGMLMSYEEDLPSPVLGFLQIPQSILAAIIPFPGGNASASGGSKGSVGPGSNSASAKRPNQ